MRQEKLTFAAAGGHILSARLDRPDGPPRAHALFAHCFTCGKDIAAARRIARRLADLGIAVMRFDFTGLGHSGGEFGNSGFSANVDDLVAAAEAMAERDEAPSILIGHSLGGAAVIAAAPRIESVRAVVTIGAPAEPGHALAQFGQDLSAVREHGTAEVSIGGRPFTVSRSFVEDLEGAQVETTLNELRAALLVLHAPRDQTVGIDNAARIFAAAKHPKSFLSLHEADHLLSDERDAAYVAKVVAAWASRYALPATDTDRPTSAPEGVTRSTEADPNGFLQHIDVGGYRLTADEPVALGGTAQGPGPYDLLTASLAACTSMTIRMYARRKDLPLTHVSVDVAHDRVHAQDCADCEAAEARIDRFTRRITLEGPLSSEQRDRLLAIADRCPVHRTLEASARIETEAAPAS
ncbi:MAG: alpha/beta fold hydrolase [Pseudomonadota bacterium]